jgi:RNA polymerase sigma-70 factor (ECF subfamily)
MNMFLHAASTAAAPTTAPCTFAEVYRDNAARVARWVSCLGSVDCDVEDVVQEVFLVVSRKLAGFRSEGTFASWLFQITRKIVANHRRRSRWRQLWTGHDEELERMPWGGSDPSVELERRRMVALLQRALDRLPDKYRTVFVLYEIDGLSTQAIAELCRRNLSTVKVQLARGRERFMRAYQRLLRREAEREGVGLANIAFRAVRPDAEPLPYAGRKGS